LIPHQLSVGKEHHSLRIAFRQGAFMRHQQDGHAQTLIAVMDKVHDFDSGVAVKISRGFIGKKDAGGVYQCPRQGHALLFPAGELPRPVSEALT
jgi:hypothetical protein